jgi:hypothetical protein
VAGNRSSKNGIETGGMVIRIDPTTDRIVARILLGNVAADGLVVSHGLVWVAAPPTA